MTDTSLKLQQPNKLRFGYFVSDTQNNKPNEINGTISATVYQQSDKAHCKPAR